MTKDSIPISTLDEGDYAYVLVMPDLDSTCMEFECLVARHPNIMDPIRMFPDQIDKTLMSFTVLAKVRAISNERRRIDMMSNEIGTEILSTHHLSTLAYHPETLLNARFNDDTWKVYTKYPRGTDATSVSNRDVVLMEEPAYCNLRTVKVTATSKDTLLQLIRETENILYNTVSTECDKSQQNIATASVKRYARGVSHMILKA